MSTLPGTKARRRIYLMRHGHVDYLAKHVVATGGINIVPLTNRGRQQALAAGHALAHITFDRAICSGYPRTKETADHVLMAQANPPKLEIDEGFVELPTGKFPPVKNREELVTIMRARPKPGEARQLREGEEDPVLALERSLGSLKRTLKEPGWHTALLVAHEGINRIMISWASGMPPGMQGAFEQDTGCINVLDFDLTPDGEIERSMIKAVNITPYNYLKHGMNLTSLEALFERNATEGLR
jgi:broad specificity phosphatase PhoE